MPKPQRPKAHKPTELDTPIQPVTESVTTAHTDESVGYSRVSPEKAVNIARLKRLNPKITQEEIARAIGVGQSTVSRWLDALGDNTVTDARNLMKAQALPAAMGIVEQTSDSDPRVRQGALKAVLALAGVQEGSAQVQVGVQVIVGSVGQPAGPDPFDVVNVTKRSSDKAQP